MNLVIKILVFVYFTLACSSSNKTFQDESNWIIQMELSRQMNMIETKPIYLEFSQNDDLLDFFKDQLDKGADSKMFEYRIGKKNNSIIFNDIQLKYLITRIRQIKVNYMNLKLHDDIILVSKPNDYNKENVIERITRFNIFLSNPVFTKNNELCLISFAFGRQDEMQGGISIYKNENGKWKFENTINSWIE